MSAVLGTLREPQHRLAVGRSRLVVLGGLLLVISICTLALSRRASTPFVASDALLHPLKTFSRPRTLSLDRRHLQAIARLRQIAIMHWQSNATAFGLLPGGGPDDYALLPVRDAVAPHIPPTTVVGRGHGYRDIVLPRRPPLEQRAIPPVIFQKWSEEVVGPVTHWAMTSFIEDNPDYDWVCLNDAAADAYAASWMIDDDPKLDVVHARLYRALREEQLRPRAAGDDPTLTYVAEGCGDVAHVDMASLALTNDERQRLRTAYSRLVVPATRADLLRYLIAYDVGGVYLDADSLSIAPLREWMDSAATFVTATGGFGDPVQGAIISSPRHPVIAHVLRSVLTNIEARDDLTLQIDLYAVAGPPVLHQCFAELLCSFRWHDPLADGLQFFKPGGIDTRLSYLAPGIKEEWKSRGHQGWLEWAISANIKKEEMAKSAAAAAQTTSGTSGP